MILTVKTGWLTDIGMTPDQIKLHYRWYDGKDNARDIEIDHEALSPDEFNKLRDLARKMAAKKVPGSFALEQKLGTLYKLLTDAKGTKVSNLKELEAVLTEFVRQLPNGWLFREVGGRLLPVVVTEVEYHQPTRDNPASCSMDDAWYELGAVTTGSTRWNMSSLSEEEAVKARAFFEGDEDFNVEDSCLADEPDPQPKAKRKAGRTVVELLREKGFYPETDKALTEYHETIASYGEVSRAFGKQYVAADAANAAADGKPLAQDGVLYRLVIDDTHEGLRNGRYRDDDDDSKSKSGTTRTMQPSLVKSDVVTKKNVKDEDGNDKVVMVKAPLHPWVTAFNLGVHDWVKVMACDVIPYVYNPNLADMLVLPADIKNVISILVDSAARRFDDVIAGKLSGTFVLSTGPAGTGKTLTAEVYSERLERPLYSVQCSQLGTDETQIEKILTPILRRAQRWGAILLIDEADVYVRERSHDIQQNAIVGVFLRLLERYHGVIFMTSNLDSIDDAIYSRATAHVRYDYPDAESLQRIFAIHLKLAGAPDCLASELGKNYCGISGRTAKQLVRLAVSWAGGPKETRLSSFKAVEQFQRMQLRKS